MNNSSVSYLRKPLALLGAGLSVFAASAAFAQTDTSTSTDKDKAPVKLDQFVVTGSYIPAAADESKAMPVTVIDAKAIADSGVDTNVLDLLRKTVPAIVGGNNVGIENANTGGGYNNGAEKVALHNTTTLILINGKRVANAPVSASGASGSGDSFVDLAQVPAAAIDRIEILTDGASALYGSEAVSGVINIILKKDYQGMEIGTNFGFASKDSGGYYQTRSANLTVGAANKDTRVTVTASWNRTDPLYEREMNYTSPAYGTASFPGIINQGGSFYRLNTSLTTPPLLGPGGTATSLANLVAAGVYVPISSSAVSNIFDLSHFPTFLGSSYVESAIMNFSHDINQNLTINGDFLYTKSGNQYNLNAQPISFGVNAILGVAGVPITDSGVTVRNRLSPPVGPLRIYKNDTTAIRGNISLDGKIGENYTYQLGVVDNISTQDAIGYNQILNSALQTAIRSGVLNLFSTAITPAQLAAANIFGDSLNINTTKLLSYNALLTGKPFEIYSGPVQFAVGAEWRRNFGNAEADANSLYNPATGTSAWNNGVTINPFNAAQTVTSYFGELKVPVAKPENHIPGVYTLDLDLAERNEAYKGGASTTVPKYGLRWLPLDDEFAFRASISKSFSAPSLYQLYGPISQGATTATGGLTAYNSSGVAIGNFPNLQGQSQSGSNPLLNPATAKGNTAGVVISPTKIGFLKGLTLTVDYFHIKEAGLIGTSAGALTIMQDVEHYGTASQYWSQLTLNNFAPQGGVHVTGPGQVSINPANVYVTSNLQNVTNQTQEGEDINLAYTYSTASLGKFTLDSAWTYYRRFNFAGTDYQGTTGGYGTIPHASTYSSVAWDYEAYHGFVGFKYIPGVGDINSGRQVGSYTSVDLELRTNVGELVKPLKGLSVTLGINNVFNKFPPLDPDSYGNPPADTGTYGSFGRFYYVGGKYKF